MKQFSFAVLALVCLTAATSSFAQSATVIESTTQKHSYTFANASGFSIGNNGSLVYNDRLNQLTGSPCCSSATLTVNGESVTVNSSMVEADTGLAPKFRGGNTLSSSLSNAEIPISQGVNQINLQYSVTVGGVTRVGTSDSYTRQEKVDGQSLSIFPQFSPSVFP